MSDPTPAAVKPAAPANRNTLVIGLVVVNMLGMLGLGAYLVLSTRAGAQPPASAEAEEPDPSEEEVGPLVEFESMVVNLHEPTSDHYLKLTFQLELSSEEAAPQAEAHMTPFRDAVLMYLTSLSVEEVAGPDGARTVRERLLELAHETMGEHTVRHLYFTEYLVQ